MTQRREWVDPFGTPAPVAPMRIPGLPPQRLDSPQPGPTTVEEISGTIGQVEEIADQVIEAFDDAVVKTGKVRAQLESLGLTGNPLLAVMTAILTVSVMFGLDGMGLITFELGYGGI